LAPHVRGYLHVVASVMQTVNPSADGSFVFKDVPQGKYTLSVGGGQPGTGAPSSSGDFEIKGQVILSE